MSLTVAGTGGVGIGVPGNGTALYDSAAALKDCLSDKSVCLCAPEYEDVVGAAGACTGSAVLQNFHFPADRKALELVFADCEAGTGTGSTSCTSLALRALAWLLDAERSRNPSSIVWTYRRLCQLRQPAGRERAVMRAGWQLVRVQGTGRSA